MRILILTLLILSGVAFGQDCTEGQYLIDGKCVTSTCKKGEYLARNGQCLHDRTGESSPAGDGCNTTTCMDPSCRLATTTLMACLHGDDPADLAPIRTPYVSDGGGAITGTAITFTSSTLSAPPLPKTYCGKNLIGAAIYKKDKLYECVSKRDAKKVKK